MNRSSFIAIATGLMIAGCADPESFRKKPLKSMKLASTPGEMTVQIPALAPGDYAVMIFHDQNGDGKLNRNLLGIPKEP